MLRKSVMNVGLGLTTFCLATSAVAWSDNYYASDNYYSYTQAPVPLAVPNPYGLTDAGFVIGIGGGYANTHWDNVPTNGLTSISPDGFAGQIFLGYDFSRYFRLQGGYFYLPKATDDTFVFQATNYVLDILAKLSLPVSTGFSIYALAGGSYLHSSVSNPNGLPVPSDGSLSHFGPAFGVGAAYEL